LFLEVYVNMPGTTQLFTFCILFYTLEAFLFFGALATSAFNDPYASNVWAQMTQGVTPPEVHSFVSVCSSYDIPCIVTTGAFSVGASISGIVAYLIWIGSKLLLIFQLPAVFGSLGNTIGMGIELTMVNFVVGIFLLWSILTSLLGGS